MSIRIKAILIALCLTPTTLLANFEVRWQLPQGGSEELFAGALRDSSIVKDAMKLGQLSLRWPSTLTLNMGGNGYPRYDTRKQSITIPYAYLAHAVQSQYKFEESRAASLQRGLDVVEYTLYHLLGHALLNNHDVESDEAAEALATWLMVTQFNNGGEQWLDNVLAFGRASQKLDGPLEDYWHGHGLNKRSAQRLNCLVVGSGPARYFERFPSLAESPNQQDTCVAQWRELEGIVNKRYTIK